jgi:hypothetical protein
MEILDTIEVRWFIEDLSSPEASAGRAWFEGVQPEGDRTDRYLVTDRCDVGFKARREQGKHEKVETKYLVDSLGPMQLHDRFTGNVERWRKLSLDLVDTALEKTGTWVRVEKRRRLRRYRYENGAVSLIDDPTECPDAGCGLELTELEYHVASENGRALTIGVEAFGPRPILLDVFLRASKRAFESASGLRLTADRSESYPRWLRRVHETGPGASSGR